MIKRKDLLEMFHSATSSHIIFSEKNEKICFLRFYKVFPFFSDFFRFYSSDPGDNLITGVTLEICKNSN